jgi:hypothetical protein
MEGSHHPHQQTVESFVADLAAAYATSFETLREEVIAVQ